MVHNQVKKPTERGPSDPITTRLYAEKREMPSPVGLPPDWRIVPAGGISGDGLTGEWVEPADPDLHDDTPVVLYLHGGGYLLCSLRTYHPTTVSLATYARARVCVPNYRLTFEHPLPTPMENALFIYRTLVTQGVLPSRIVVAGNSAGGGLVLAPLAALRDATDSLPADAVLYSPWTGFAVTGQSLANNDKSGVMFRGVQMTHDTALYLDDSGALADYPLASPLCADFMGPPILRCYVNTSEVLRDDTLRMTEQAQTIGISVSIEMGRRLPHVWSIFYPSLPKVRVVLE